MNVGARVCERGQHVFCQRGDAARRPRRVAGLWAGRLRSRSVRSLAPTERCMSALRTGGCSPLTLTASFDGSATHRIGESARLLWWAATGPSMSSVCFRRSTIVTGAACSQREHALSVRVSGGAMLWATWFPEGIPTNWGSGTTTASPNVWRSGSDEVIIVPTCIRHTGATR